MLQIRRRLVPIPHNLGVCITKKSKKKKKKKEAFGFHDSHVIMPIIYHQQPL